MANRLKRPGYDVEHVMTLIEETGASLDPEIIEIRRDHLDPLKKKELTVIIGFRNDANFRNDLQLYTQNTTSN